jgi:hypothetical protein
MPAVIATSYPAETTALAKNITAQNVSGTRDLDKGKMPAVSSSRS